MRVGYPCFMYVKDFARRSTLRDCADECPIGDHEWREAFWGGAPAYMRVTMDVRARIAGSQRTEVQRADQQIPASL